MFARGNLLYSVGGFYGLPSSQFMVLQHDRCAWYTLQTTCANNTLCAWVDGTGCREQAAAPVVTSPAVGTTRLVTTLPSSQLLNCRACAAFKTQPECDRNYAVNSCVWCASNGTCLTVGAGVTPTSTELTGCQRWTACFSGQSPARSCSRARSRNRAGQGTRPPAASARARAH